MKLSDETLLCGRDAREAFPVTPSEATYYRWLLKGARGVVLDSTVIGGRRYTSREAINRFIEAQNERAHQTPVEPNSPPLSRRVEAARNALDAIGL